MKIKIRDLFMFSGLKQEEANSEARNTDDQIASLMTGPQQVCLSHDIS